MSAEFRIVVVDETGQTYGRGSAQALARPEASDVQTVAQSVVQAVEDQKQADSKTTGQPASPTQPQGAQPGQPVVQPADPNRTANVPGPASQPGQPSPAPAPTQAQPATADPHAESNQPRGILGRLTSLLSGGAKGIGGFVKAAFETNEGVNEVARGVAHGDVPETRHGLGVLMTQFNHLLGKLSGVGHGQPGGSISRNGEDQRSLTETLRDHTKSLQTFASHTLNDAGSAIGRVPGRIAGAVRSFGQGLSNRIGWRAGKSIIKNLTDRPLRRLRVAAWKMGKRLRAAAWKRGIPIGMRGAGRAAGSAAARVGGMVATRVAGTALGSAATGIGSTLGALGVAVGTLTGGLLAAVGAITLFTSGLKALANSIEKDAQKFAGYSPQVSMALGQRAMRDEQHMIHRAEKFGDRAAKVIDFNTRWRETMQKYGDAFVELKLWVFETFQGWMESVLWALDWFIGWNKKKEADHPMEDPFLMGMLGRGEQKFAMPAGW